MPNTFLTPTIIAREAVMVLVNNLVAANLFYRDHEVEWKGVTKVGDTVKIRKPPTFTAQEFSTTVSVQNATEGQISLTLEKHYDITVQITSAEKTLKLNDFSKQVLEPIMVAHAEAIDLYILSKYYQVPTMVGTAGDPPDTIADLAAVRKQLNTQKVPMRGRIGIMDPTADADFLSIEAVHSAEKRGDNGTALREASLGRVLGIDWFMDQNVPSHTAGAMTGTIDVSGAHAAGVESVLLATGAAEAINLNKGDVITFAGSTQRYAVQADLDVGASSSGSVSIHPPLQAALSGAEVVTLQSTTNHVANLAGHPFGLAVAIVPLDLPFGAPEAGVASWNGISVRYVYSYDASTKKDTMSFDLLVGAVVQDYRLLTRNLG